MENQKINIQTPQPEAYVGPKSSKLPLFLVIFAVIVLVVGLAIGLIYKTGSKDSLLQTIKDGEERKVDPTLVRLPVGFNKELQKGPYNCPTLELYCQDADLYKESSFSANLRRNSPIYAAFDGKFEVFEISLPGSGEVASGTLINLEKGLKANYYYRGTTMTSGDVKAGQQIASSSGLLIAKYKRAFVFELTKIGVQEELSTKATISQNDFK